MSNQYIQSISYSKLAEYDQKHIDLSIRKYVLITNLLRDENKIIEEDTQMELEQHWFDTCINELVNDSIEEDFSQDQHLVEQEQLYYQQQQQQQQERRDNNVKDLSEQQHYYNSASNNNTTKPSSNNHLHLHVAFYNSRNESGFLVCSTGTVIDKSLNIHNAAALEYF